MDTSNSGCVQRHFVRNMESESAESTIIEGATMTVSESGIVASADEVKPADH